jgi:two-component system, NarL family, sensor histidine kinase UhpB
MFGRKNALASEAGRRGAFGGRLPPIFGLVLAVLVVQAVYWLLVNPLIFTRSHGEHTSFELSDFQAAEIRSPDSAGLAAAQFKPIEGPGWYDCCAPSYRAIRFQVDIPKVPEEGLGVLTQVAADNVQVRINGAIVLNRGRIALPDNTYHANETRIDYVPASAVHEGKNQVDYILVRNAMPYFDLFKPTFGPLREVEAAFGQQAFMFGPFEMICIISGFVLAIFAFVLLIQSESKGFAFALFLLIAAWTLKAHFYSWSDPPLGGMARLYFYFLLTALVPVAWLNFADQWTGKPMRWVGTVCAAVYLAMAAALAFALWGLPSDAGFDRASEILNIEGLAVMALTFARLALHAVKRGDSRHWEIAIFILILLLATLEFANEFFWQTATGYLTRTTPLLIIALTIAVFSRSIRLFRSADQINQVLSERLSAREAELVKAHEREREFVRRQAHDDERQRILRDMHDGLGSQLMSMLLAARRGEVRPDRIAEGLQSVVDEMRLMIASMDSVGKSLFAALSLFRDRMTPRVEAAGFKLEWTNTYGSDFPDYGSRPTLQIFRILQEAVANALKHSAGKVISVSIEPRPDAPHLPRITVRDDGGGKAAAPGTGRGLANMRTRAAAIGAQIDITLEQAGARVTLDLPAPANDASAEQRANAADAMVTR